ncbi:MAG: hypothetical protein HY286_10780 [Planctomycetes bacterium]|nr:hypothetical protein [Planctomycetota bacterium]
MTRGLFFILSSFAAACSSAPLTIEPRIVASGREAGLDVPVEAVFKSAAEFQEYSKALHKRYPNTDVPVSAPNVDFGAEILILILGGESEFDQKVVVPRIWYSGSTLLIRWTRIHERADRVFNDDDSSLPAPPSEPEPRIRPFLLAAIPARNGPIRFLNTRQLLDAR